MSEKTVETRQIRIEELTSEAFRGFGELIEVGATSPIMINEADVSASLTWQASNSSADARV